MPCTMAQPTDLLMVKDIAIANAEPKLIPVLTTFVCVFVLIVITKIGSWLNPAPNRGEKEIININVYQ